MNKEPSPPKEVLKFFAEEVFPLERAIVPIFERVIDLRVGFREAVTRRQLHSLERDFADLALKWAAIIEKVYVPDKLFPSDDSNAPPRDIPRGIVWLLAQGGQSLLNEHQRRISTMMENVNELLSAKRNEANFNAIALLSFVAILVAVVSLVISGFS